MQPSIDQPDNLVRNIHKPVKDEESKQQQCQPHKTYQKEQQNNHEQLLCARKKVLLENPYSVKRLRLHESLFTKSIPGLGCHESESELRIESGGKGNKSAERTESDESIESNEGIESNESSVVSEHDFDETSNLLSNSSSISLSSNATHSGFSSTAAKKSPNISAIDALTAENTSPGPASDLTPVDRKSHSKHHQHPGNTSHKTHRINSTHNTHNTHNNSQAIMSDTPNKQILDDIPFWQRLLSSQITFGAAEIVSVSELWDRWQKLPQNCCATNANLENAVNSTNKTSVTNATEKTTTNSNTIPNMYITAPNTARNSNKALDTAIVKSFRITGVVLFKQTYTDTSTAMLIGDLYNTTRRKTRHDFDKKLSCSNQLKQKHSQHFISRTIWVILPPPVSMSCYDRCSVRDIVTVLGEQRHHHYGHLYRHQYQDILCIGAEPSSLSPLSTTSIKIETTATLHQRNISFMAIKGMMQYKNERKELNCYPAHHHQKQIENRNPCPQSAKTSSSQCSSLKHPQEFLHNCEQNENNNKNQEIQFDKIEKYNQQCYFIEARIVRNVNGMNTQLHQKALEARRRVSFLNFGS